MYPFILKAHERAINVVKLNYDGDLLFTGSADSLINLWEAHTGQRIGSYTTLSAVKSLDVDLNSKYLIYVSFAGTLQVFEVKTGLSLKFVRLPYKLKQVEFSVCGKKFFVLQDQLKMNCPSIITVFDLKTFLELKSNEDGQISEDLVVPQLSFATHIGTNNPQNRISTRVHWYIDGKSFFAATNQGDIIRYNYDGSFHSKATIHDTPINSFTFSNDFSILATAANDGCKIIDPQTFQIIRYFKQQLPMNTISVSPLFCSPKNPKYHIIMGGGVPSMMAAMTRGKSGFQATICNVMYGNQVGRVPGHFGPINSIEFFKDGLGYISAGQDSYVRVVRFEDSYMDLQ